MKYALLSLIVGFFAINMGASGIAPSFASAYGAKLIQKKKAILLFSLFVIAGALLLGRNVAVTLGKDLLVNATLHYTETAIVLGSAGAALFLANVLKIPQSTSQITVGAITGIGLYSGRLNWPVLFCKILPFWLVLPLLSYVLTMVVYKTIYPPERDNLHLYQKVFANENKLHRLALTVSCYVAFAIGTNNVGNAVGPLSGAGIIDILPGLALIAPLFGIGAWALGDGTLTTAGKEIVPLGLVSSTLVSFVTATLLIVASWAGVPQSLVQLNLASIFAISCLKNGHKYTWDQGIIRKTLIVWAVTPLLALGFTYGLLSFLARR